MLVFATIMFSVSFTENIVLEVHKEMIYLSFWFEKGSIQADM